MKYKSLMGIVALAVTAGGVLAQQSIKAQLGAPASKLRPLVTLSNAGGSLPTEEEIKTFVSEYKESDGNKETVSLSVRFSVPKMPPEQRKKFEHSKKVPYRLFVDLITTKEVKGKRVSTRTTNGKINVAILDETGKVVKQSSENLIKLCAS